jgi:hypothetical protein
MTRHTDDTTTDRRRTTADANGADDGDPTDERTMGAVSHTHPETGETFGDSQVYQRGTVVMVDGGEADSATEDRDDEPMKDVDHTPREDAPSTHEVYERGGEGGETAETADDETPDEETNGEPDGEAPV